MGILSMATASGQAPKKAPQAPRKVPVPHTPWGDPDLQGVWNDATSTPLQRPGGVGTKDILSDEEAQEFQQQLANVLSRDRRVGGPGGRGKITSHENWVVF